MNTIKTRAQLKAELEMRSEASCRALQAYIRKLELERAQRYLQWYPDYRKNYRRAYDECMKFLQDETQTGPLKLRLKYNVNLLLQNIFPKLTFVLNQFVSDDNEFAFDVYKTE